MRDVLDGRRRVGALYKAVHFFNHARMNTMRGFAFTRTQVRAGRFKHPPIINFGPYSHPMNKFDTSEAMTEILESHGGFFAFSQSQLDEKMIRCVRYFKAGAGLILPVANRQSFDQAYDALIKQKYAYELANNSAADIIKYELSNHECYYSGDISDAVSALQPYGFTEDAVLKVFNEERVKDEYYS